MRRFAKMIPQEISLTQEGANRRVIATYKNRKDKSVSEQEVSKAAPREGASMNIQEAIQNTPQEIVQLLESITKSSTASGKGYTPQAASVMKAVGRMLAPFSDELSLDDLKTIGQAAGFQGCDQSVSKSVGKGKDEDDDTDAGASDEGRAINFSAAAADDDDDDADAEQEMVETAEPPEDDEPEESKQDKSVKKSVLTENVALEAKKDDTGADADAESEGPDDDSAEEVDDTQPANAKAWGQPKGTKAKGETVAKSAMTGSSAGEEHYSEIRKSLERQRQENEALKEAIAKTRADLDEERSFRALENIKKSVKADYGHLNVDVEALAPVLKSLKEAKDSALYDQLTATLKAADAQVKAAQEAGGLFQAVGKSSSRNAAAGAGATWADKIDARVDEEFQKNAKGRVKAQVYDHFVETEEGREMLSNHRAEMAQTRGF